MGVLNASTSPPKERYAVSKDNIIKLQAWFREQRAKLSRSSDTTKAINYCLSRRDCIYPLP